MKPLNRSVCRILVVLLAIGLAAGCGSSGEEECKPGCDRKICGDDGCGGSCGECNAGETCDQGQCVGCDPDCAGKVCGDDGCGGTCGACDTGEACEQGQCVSCDPDCAGKECGDDGCGGSCGACDTGEVCDQGQCVGCNPDCAGKECGDDGCSGTCGNCSGGETCNDAGQCVTETSVDPRTGVWEYAEYADSVDDCNSDELISNGAGPFELIDNGDGTFDIVPGDGSGTFTCTLDGADFTCPERAAADEDMDPLDAVLSVLVTVTGTFDSNQRMHGQQDAVVTCTGSQCAEVEAALSTDFPCHFTVDFIADWTDELQCQPDCSGRACGPDPDCGLSCGSCAGNESCNTAGQCVPDCIPDCGGRECGTDGCSGDCGSCSGGETCNAAGQCIGSGVEPRSGIWHYDEYTASQNDCNSDTVLNNGDGYFELNNHGNGTFTIVPGDGTDPFTCTLAGADYSCQRMLEDVDWDPLDAMMSGSATVDGSFSDPESSTGQQAGALTCAGSHCSAIAAQLGTSFPCAFTIQYTASWVSN